MGNIYNDMNPKNPSQSSQNTCVMCSQPINLLDDYSFTFHPQFKFFCPTHKYCQNEYIIRDSSLVVVPKFELKAISEVEISNIDERRPKSISVDFEIIHPFTKQTLFQKCDMVIPATVLHQ